MKILYEVSSLGIGHINPVGRAGVFRYIENLVVELIKIEGLEIDFISCNNLLESIFTNQYFVKCRPSLRDSYIQVWNSKLISNQVYLNFLQNCHDKHSKNLLSKCIRKIQSIILKFADFTSYTNYSLKNIDYDIFHTFFYALPDFHKFSLSVKHKIITIYDIIPLLYPSYFESDMSQHFLRIINSIDCQKDWVICISKSTKNDFCNLTNMSPDRVFVTPLSASKNFYRETNITHIQSTYKKYNIPEGKYILSLATLEPRKNVIHLITCFNKLISQEKLEDIYLILVGSKGWLYDRIFQTVNEHPRLKDKVIFTGYIPDEDLSAIYSGANFFVYPSLYEGFGLPPLEAMQCGVPVIASNSSSLPEVVGDAGILVDPRDEDSLCQAMIELLNNQNICEQLSQAGIMRSKLFNWEKTAKQTLEIYQQII